MISRDEVAEIIAKRLREGREHMGCSVNQLAELADVHPGTLKRLESGASVPLAMTLAKVATALYCEPADLLPTLAELKPGKRPKTQGKRPSGGVSSRNPSDGLLRETFGKTLAPEKDLELSH